MANPDGWAQEPDGTWRPPVRAVQYPPESQTEVPPNVKKSTIRDGAVEVRDAEDDLVVRMGKLSDGSYGLELLEGGLIVQRLANTSLTINNAAGNTIITLGQESDGDANLTIFNDAGVKKVIVGEDGSDFDVKVFDDAGVAVKLSTLAFGLQAAEVATSESTSSATYTDLATVGPQVTVTIGPSGRAIVQFSAEMFLDVGPGGSADQAFMSFAVSGASTVAASDARSGRVLLARDSSATTLTIQWEGSIGRALLLTGLTPGVNVFTAKYKTNGVSLPFANRVLVVTPF